MRVNDLHRWAKMRGFEIHRPLSDDEWNEAAAYLDGLRANHA